MQVQKSKFKTNYFYNILIFSPLIIFSLFIGLIIRHYVLLVPKKNVVETVGTITGYSSGGKGGNSAILTFASQGKTFEVLTKAECNIGEKFIVEFEKNNPTANRISLDKPIFLKNEETSIAVAIVTKYNPNYFREIYFVYCVDGISYEKWYEPAKDVEIRYPNLKESEKYYIKYWIENPQRSIILLDSPVPPATPSVR